MNWRLEFDIYAINGEGKYGSPPEVSFEKKFTLRKSRWSYKEEDLPGEEFTKFYNGFKHTLPSGVDCNYKIVKKELGGYCDSLSYVIVKIIICPSSEYINDRYYHYYSRDFENNLLTNHSKELDSMYAVFSSNSYVTYDGLYVKKDYVKYDVDCCILSFSSLGLNFFTSLSQLYTLSKVLTEHLSVSQGKNYYVRAYPITDIIKKETTIAFDVDDRPCVVSNPSELKDW